MKYLRNRNKHRRQTRDMVVNLVALRRPTTIYFTFILPKGIQTQDRQKWTNLRHTVCLHPNLFPTRS